jgi:hypothetical protein
MDTVCTGVLRQYDNIQCNPTVCGQLLAPVALMLCTSLLFRIHVNLLVRVCVDCTELAAQVMSRCRFTHLQYERLLTKRSRL